MAEDHALPLSEIPAPALRPSLRLSLNTVQQCLPQTQAASHDHVCSCPSAQVLATGELAQASQEGMLTRLHFVAGGEGELLSVPRTLFSP